MDLKLIQSYIQLETINGEPQHNHHQWHNN